MKQNCRVCGDLFFQDPLLGFKDMPAAAQCFPDAKSLAADHGVAIEVCQCSGCGLVQLSNEPVPYYKEVIRAAAFSDEMRQFRLRQFAAFIDKYALHGQKVVEVGCGRGEFLALLHQGDVKAYGIEGASASVAECRKRGLDVTCGFIENRTQKLDAGPFDAFLILNYLEHLPAPLASLKGIHSNLASGAVGLVEVPNFDMILRQRLFAEFIPDHLFYFTKDTLRTTLQLSGFEVLEVGEVWHDYIISAVVRKRAAADVSEFYQHQEKLRTVLHAYFDRFSAVAVWGAGHQSLATISLLNLAPRIQYVVDSAPFKQGKFTPATHLRVVPPDTLIAEPVDAVVVMAASYSDEVARLIRQRFDHKLEVAILRDFGLETA